jgi:hypothetical protein
MSLIPERLAIFVLAALVGGCSSTSSFTSEVSTDVSTTVRPVVHLQQKVPPTEQFNDTPIPTDGAMAMRAWDPTPVYYVNDAVWSWPDYTPLQPGVLPYDLNMLTEPFLFLGNLIYIAPGVFLEIPWQLQVYKSLSPPPSYTCMPPLPAGVEPIPTN